jgi:hypothetical protein
MGRHLSNLERIQRTPGYDTPAIRNDIAEMKSLRSEIGDIRGTLTGVNGTVAGIKDVEHGEPLGWVEIATGVLNIILTILPFFLL